MLTIKKGMYSSTPGLIQHKSNGLLAQLVEQWTFNPLVAGSSPAQPTRGSIAQLVEQRTLNP